jgi:hypothetical protein
VRVRHVSAEQQRALCNGCRRFRDFVASTQYLDGAEVDCDLVFDNGRPVYGAITDNWPTVEPYFNETGSNCPSVLPKAAQVGRRCAAAPGAAPLHPRAWGAGGRDWNAPGRRGGSLGAAAAACAVFRNEGP